MVASPRRSRRFTLIAFPLSFLFGCQAHDGESSSAVFLRSGPLTPELAAAEVAKDHAWARRVIRFQRTPDTHTARKIEAAGGRVDAVLPGHGYLVSIPTVAVSALDRLPQVEWVIAYPNHAKVSPEISSLDPAAPGLRTNERVTIIIELFADADPRAVAADLRALGLETTGHRQRRRFGRIVARSTVSKLGSVRDSIAAHPDVFWVGQRAPRVIFNDTSIWVGQSGLEGGEATPLFDRGINGAGQIGAVLDSGLDVDHCMFYDEKLGLPPANTGFDTEVDLAQRKVIAYDMLHDEDDPSGNGDWDGHGHGTHVAGSIAGDQGSNGTHESVDGMAPGAKLVVQDGGGGANYTDDCSDMPALGCPVADLHPIFEQAYAQGARIHNNSWGDRENFSDAEVYSDGCQDVDEFMWDNPDFLLVFAAGNSGPSASTVASPSVAKSALSVGATARGSGAAALAGFSSRGPAGDGRIKPDVTFPGSGIQSASNDTDVTTMNCGSRSMSGTSMASPGATGMTLLARQYYADGFYPSGVATSADGFQPSAALLKATMIASGVHMTSESEIPSMDQGWGRIQLDTVLAFDDSDFALFVHDVEDGPASPDEGPSTYEIEVLSTDQPVKITLVWTDYPSTPAAEMNLVNDLDLLLNGPSGTFLGNVYEGGVSVTGGEADRLNNVEQIWLATPTVGTHTLEVSPHAIPMGPQPYALVITGDVTVVPPDGGDESGDSEEDGDESSEGEESGASGDDSGAEDDASDSGSDGEDAESGESGDDDPDESDGDEDDSGAESDGADDASDDSGGQEQGDDMNDDGSGTGGEDEPTDGGDEGSEGDDTGPGLMDESGCSCRTTGEDSPEAWLLGLTVLPVLRRRRRYGSSAKQ